MNRYAREWVRFTGPYERQAARRFRREFSRVARDAADLYARSGEVGLAFAMTAHETRLVRLIETTYRLIGRPSAVRFMREVEAGRRKKDDPAPPSEWADRFARWIRTAALLRARQIAETTREAIREALAALVVEEALTNVSARKAIEEAASGTVGRKRAAVIARTEVNGAANRAQIEAAEAVALPHVVEWVSVEDARTRPSHSRANGQQVEPGGSFTVGGVAMRHPGDPAAPAREVVNCRCATRVRIKLEGL